MYWQAFEGIDPSQNSVPPEAADILAQECRRVSAAAPPPAKSTASLRDSLTSTVDHLMSQFGGSGDAHS